MAKSYEIAQQIFMQHHGILRTGQAKKLGIDQKILNRMHKAGLLIRETRGVYRLANLEPLTNPDIVHVSIRVPSSVMFLISALAFHNLTTQIPYYVYIALPADVKAPYIEYPPLRVYRLSNKIYSAGIEYHIIDGVEIRIYNREKTIADCFKFRNKIGQDIAIEALKDYLRQPNPNIPKLLEYARLDRVEKIMRPYLQAVL
jgi:predicted transcriptional regulator of viral defense system